MKDEDKTKDQLINELVQLRQRVVELETSEAQRQQTEAAIRQSEERFRLLVQEAKEYAIFMMNTDGYIVSWNTGAERILGYQAAEIIGQHFSCIFTPEEIQHGVPEQALQKAVAEDRSDDERWHVRKNGTRFWANGIVMPLRDENGNLQGFSKILRDFTKPKQAESERAQLLVREQAARAQAEVANRIKDEFLSILSHELRTPLTSMLLWAELLRQGNLDSSTTAQALETIERNTKSQIQLIDDLLDISCIITGKLRLSVELVELVPLIEATIDTVRPSADLKAIQIQTVLDPEVDQVFGDPVRLQQIVWNLLLNAIKFTSTGGRVEVRLTRTDSYARITVRDTGQGISAEFLPYVFDRFRQADSTTTRSGHGLGLGLAIVRHLVELHGGTVHADSGGEGQGATFTVSLPLMTIPTEESDEERVYPTVSDSVLPDGSLNLDGLRVLIVDDDSSTREALSVILKQYGTEVMAVESTTKALEALEQFRPDVLVADIGMPEEDGYTLIRKVRALEAERGGRIRAVALTAYASESDRARALSAGFQIHLAKPVEPTGLISVVANLAGRTGNV